ncbi:hypothetical protein [Candidatus Sodalis sp. SoCistrobi]|uniref:hypothetical protein n=1 Tax=Candidatus Sodalis sp. SoCistrobi TaxID=1922216 RepID=UPI00352D99A1
MPNVKVGRPAEVAQIPNNLQPVGLCGVQHWQKAGPVILAGRGLDEVPTQPIAHGSEMTGGQLGIIFRRQHFMTAGMNDIEPAAVAAPFGGAVEAALEKALE